MMDMTSVSPPQRTAGRIVLAGVFFLLHSVVQGQPPEGAGSAVEILLKIDGIEGQVAAPDRQGWVAVDSFDYTILRPVGDDQKANRVGVTLVKAVDKASPFLYLHCSSGQALDEVVLEVTRTAGDEVSTQEFRMGRVTVTSVKASAHAGAKHATERVTLHYGSIAWTYVRVDSVTGGVISEVTMHWDAAADERS